MIHDYVILCHYVVLIHITCRIVLCHVVSRSKVSSPQCIAVHQVLRQYLDRARLDGRRQSKCPQLS